MRAQRRAIRVKSNHHAKLWTKKCLNHLHQPRRDYLPTSRSRQTETTSGLPSPAASKTVNAASISPNKPKKPRLPPKQRRKKKRSKLNLKCKRLNGGHQIWKRKRVLSQSVCFRSIQWALRQGRRAKTCSSLRALMMWAATPLVVQRALTVRTLSNQCSFNRAQRKSAVSLKLSLSQSVMLLKKRHLLPKKRL